MARTSAGLISGAPSSSRSALANRAAAIWPSMWAWRSSWPGKASTIQNSDWPLRSAIHTGVPSSARARSRAPVRNSASSSSAPALAVILTTSATDTIAIPLMVSRPAEARYRRGETCRPRPASHPLMPTAPTDAPPTAPVWDDALVALYREQYVALARLAYLFTDDAGRAEEVVQDAFVRAQRAWAG